ncbi:MAG: hypothetical protein M1825_002714 [Sarcosagium campestre]|nr:MAG: hypothetical protein M1825_002714 [Sarcosagium campestre]
MPASTLVDHSPYHPSPSKPVASASNLVLIDNYDSFTWNVYQYLVLEGAKVTVYRNDKVSLQQLIDQSPTQLVVSPGPGHPDTDTGVSKEAIKYFAGKIPILGVCIGEQCIYSVFGGKVLYAGEILHGKTSPLHHDGRGIYADLEQDLPVTRYHSLAGTHSTLPPCLEISSWVARSDSQDEGVIMGVRHKEYVVEGVQFHPESILTADGRGMLKNFLKMRGGTWAENSRSQEECKKLRDTTDHVNGLAPKADGSTGLNGDKGKSILDRIYEHRKRAVAEQMTVPSQRPVDLEAAYALNIAPPQISFAERIKSSPFPLSLMAEIKRASPSKGVISISTCAPAQARLYALAGASVISVLTEPEWFKGSIEDLRAVRQALEGTVNRPAVLRKEFIFNEYQILEARLAGADTVLLIVKMLDEALLQKLYRYSLTLGMEPLVEVNNVEEMTVAVRLGAQVIGVNNRNLTSFEVDLGTTNRLLSMVPTTTTVCALSGISGPNDVAAYQRDGVRAILVGEALMRASDTAAFIRDLLGDETRNGQLDAARHNVMVKICGTRSAEAAKVAIDAGADMLGIILVEGRRRCVPIEEALKISKVVHESQKSHRARASPAQRHAVPLTVEFFEHSQRQLQQSRRPLLVGVFQDQPLEYVLRQQNLLDLDIVQLHGSEPLEWATLIPVPVFRSFKPGQQGIGRRGYHALPLLDSAQGGSGEQLDLNEVKATLSKDKGLKAILAGGLNPENVAQVIKGLGESAAAVAVVDVSSGVEINGSQDLEKIKAFVSAVKQSSDI